MTDDYQIKPFGPMRRVIVNFLSEAKRKHTIYAIYEVDISTPTELIQEYERKTGLKLSFTGYVAKCMGESISRYPEVHAYRKGKTNLIIFDDVDIATIVEKELNGKMVPTSYTLRKANKKSLLDIHHEIRGTKTATQEDIIAEENAQPHKKQEETKKSEKSKKKGFNISKAPQFLQKLIFYKLRKDPFMKKKINGTVGLTAVGMFGNAGGWGVQITPHTMSVALGGMEDKPVVRNGEIVIRKMLSVSIAIDHDVVDGAPGARFCTDLRDRISSGSIIRELHSD